MGKVMKKILVLGSAGFLMSNLIRYMLYRTKDYEFVSVDLLRNCEDFHKVYLHRKHSFHIGNAGDEDFMDKLIWMEKPDIIIIGTTMMVPPRSIVPLVYEGLREVVLPTSIACRHALHGLHSSTWKWPYIIRLVPDKNVEDMGTREMWNYVESMILEAKGTILQLPVCFGRRGNGHFEDELRTIILGQSQEGRNPNNNKRRYAFAEDVASMLWFLMENQQLGKIIHMPALGYTSPLDMLLESSNNFTGMEESTVLGWAPDSKDMREAIDKTIKWYTMNKWVFKDTIE
jgi:hypothetical protein